MSIADRFAGSSVIKISASRVPNPALGRAVYLIDTVRMKDGRTGGFRVEVGMTCLWGINSGVDASGVERGPDHAGERVAHCLFSGEYFSRSFKEFSLKAIGKEPHEELDICDFVCPASEYPGTELERLTTMWDNVLPAMVCAFDPKTDEATDAGVFDGQVMIEIGTTEKEVEKKVEGQPMFDASGNKVVTIYTNSYFNRKIGKAEALENLGEAGVKKFFGTMDNFNTIDD